MATYMHGPDALGTNMLSVALIGPAEPRRAAMAKALSGSQATIAREFSAYPDLDEISRLLDANYDVIAVELDSNPEQALDLVEALATDSSLTVMVYSNHADSELLVRCMRAGAREFLTQPIASGTMAEALVRASARRPATRPSKKVGGKLLVFVGAKGGSGATTLASNFAVALARECNQNALLLDLDLPLGDAALDLGLTAQYSTANALQSFARLDANFLSTLLVKHSSGLSVLSAPDRYVQIQPTGEAVHKLVTVSRQEFEYVVVDGGSRLRPEIRSLLVDASAVYLVTQVTISELRNSNRIILDSFAGNASKLEIVLNRYTPRSLGIDEDSITKALTMAPQWKVPSDYPAVRKAQNTATPLVFEDSPISRVVKQMARTACNLPPDPEKKKRFSLF